MAFRVVENDLRALSLEARKRFPEVKEAAERALQLLRSAQEALPENATAAEQAAAIAAAEEVLLPFTLALACRSETLPPCALGAVQRMISHSAVAPQRLPAIASQLIARAQSAASDEPSLLKVLQTVLTIASSPALLHTDTVVSQLLLLCLTLQQSRSPTIKSTASATVQQFIALLLDLAAQEEAPSDAPATDEADHAAAAAAKRKAAAARSRLPPPPPELKHLSVASRCAYLAVQDLCLLASGEAATWLPGSGPVSVTFALEVVQRTLENQTSLFVRRPEFRYLLEEIACPLALRTMAAQQRPGQPAPDWAAALRLAHLSATLVKNYAPLLLADAERLLLLHSRLLEDEQKPIWLRALVLEVFRMLLSDATLLEQLCADCGSLTAQNAVTAVVAATSKLLHSPKIDFPQSAEFIEAHFLRHRRTSVQGRAASFNLSLYSEADGSHIGSDYTAALAIEAIVLFASTVSAMAEAAHAARPAADAAGASARASPMRPRALPPSKPANNVSLCNSTAGSTPTPTPAVPAAGDEVLKEAQKPAPAPAPPASKAEELAPRRFERGPETPSLFSVSPIHSDDEDGATGSPLPLARALLRASWPSLSSALSLLLARCAAEEAVQLLLKALQSLTHACALLGLREASDALLGSLCQYALPPRPRQDLTRTDSSASISFAPIDGAYEPLPYTSLSAKNVQALKTLFNLAHSMGGLMGVSWNLVLQTFEQLDRIIASSKTASSAHHHAAAAAPAASADPEATYNELSLLNSALSGLFLSSRRLDEAAVKHFLTALSTQCFASLAYEATSKEKLAAPGSSSGPRLFALNKFIETIMHNLDRVNALWPLVTQFLLPVANHKTARIRIIGIDALSKVVLAAMRRKLQETPEPPPPDAKPPFAAAAAAAAASPAAAPARPAVVEEMDLGEVPSEFSWDRLLLSPLEELQRRCAHRETQERILQAVHQVLHACGAGLGEGWLLILSILYRAATKPALLPLLPLAIRSVQLIAQDFLGALPPPCLLAFVEVAATYATQTEHLNVSLQAVGLQWTISDHLVDYARRANEGEPTEADSPPSEAEERERAAAEAAAEASLAEGAGTALASAARYAELDLEQELHSHLIWCAIARQMRRLVADERSEVRTSALLTLTSLVTSHGQRLSGPTWDFLLFRTLVPMMREVSEAAARASTTQPIAQQLGTEGGRPVLMLMHHSRDTASKQWDESWVTLLSSSTRLFRTFLPLLQLRPSFPGAWDRLLRFGEQSLLSAPRSPEVAKAAIGALVQELLLSSVAPRSQQRPSSAPAETAHGSPHAGSRTPPPAGSERALGERLPPSLWTSVWTLLERAVGEATQSPESHKTHAPMLHSLLEQLAELYSAARDRFEEADVLRLLKLAARLAVPPEAPFPGWEPRERAVNPSPLQLAALRLLEALPPFPHSVSADNLWPLLLWHLLKLISPRPEAPSGAPAAPLGRSPPPGKRVVAGLAERSYKLLHELLCTQTPPAARLAVLEDVLQVHRDILRYRLDPLCLCPALPNAVAASFVPLLKATLPQLVGRSEQAQRSHAELVATFRMLLAPPVAEGESSSGGGALVAEEATLELSLLQAVRLALNSLPQMDPPLRLELLERLAAVLKLPAAAAVARNACWREALAALCELAAAEQPKPAPSNIAPLPALTAVEAATSPRGAAAAASSAQAAREAWARTGPPSPTKKGPVSTRSLAVPLLLDAASAALREWATLDRAPPPKGTAAEPAAALDRAARGAQLLRMLRLLCALRVPSGSFEGKEAGGGGGGGGLFSGGGGGGGGGGSSVQLLLRRGGSETGTDPRDGPRGHLVRLAPALIACVGRPAAPGAESGGEGIVELMRGSEAYELQAAVREALLLVVGELGGLD